MEQITRTSEVVSFYGHRVDIEERNCPNPKCDMVFPVILGIQGVESDSEKEFLKEAVVFSVEDLEKGGVQKECPNPKCRWVIDIPCVGDSVAVTFPINPS